MFAIVRAADEAIIDRVFQPVLDRFVELRHARYRLAAIPVDLGAGLCLAALVISIQQTGFDADTATGLAAPVVGLIDGRVIGVVRRNPNRISLRLLRLFMLSFATGFFVFFTQFSAVWTDFVLDAYGWALCLSAYILSCDDPRPKPGRSLAPSRSILNPG